MSLGKDVKEDEKDEDVDDGCIDDELCLEGSVHLVEGC